MIVDKSLWYTIWRKPRGENDQGYERLGDFPDVGHAWDYLLAEHGGTDAEYEYRIVPMYCSGTKQRLPLPSEMLFIFKYHATHSN